MATVYTERVSDMAHQKYLRPGKNTTTESIAAKQRLLLEISHFTVQLAERLT